MPREDVMYLGPCESQYKEYASFFERELGLFLERIPMSGVLSEVIIRSLIGGGKRFRPVLSIAVADMLGLDFRRVLYLTLAIESLHCSSLVHDDLPALDDDDYRRGEPSSHKQFGEGQAILGGDALIALAFSAINSAESVGQTPPPALSAWNYSLSSAFLSLCEGQSLDLIEMGKSFVAQETLKEGRSLEQQLEERHSLKTGALIRAAIICPLQLGSDEQLIGSSEPLSNFASKIGLLFQVTDDVLDAMELEEIDQAEGASYVSLLGLDGAKRRAVEIANLAIADLNECSLDTVFLEQLTLAIRDRA